MGCTDGKSHEVATCSFRPCVWSRFRAGWYLGRIMLKRRFDVSCKCEGYEKIVTADITTSRIWDSNTGQCLKTLVHEDNAPVTSVRFSPNGKFVLAATLDSSVRLWKYVEGRCIKTYQGHKNQKYSINACFGTYVSEQEDGEEWAFAMCGDEEGKAMIWDVNTKKVLQVLTGHQGVVLGVDSNPDSSLVATCGLDGSIRVWKNSPSK